MKKIILLALTIITIGACSPGTKDTSMDASVIETDGAVNEPAFDFNGVTAWDFGKIIEGERVEHTFKFKNTGKANLVIAEHHSPDINHKITLKHVETLMHVYQSPEEYEKHYDEWTKTHKEKISPNGAANRKLYGPDLFTEVDLFAKRAWQIN